MEAEFQDELTEIWEALDAVTEKAHHLRVRYKTMRDNPAMQTALDYLYETTVKAEGIAQGLRL